MPKSQRAGSAPDATELLTKDHKEVKSLFKQYEALAEAEAPAGERETLARLICQLLTVHATYRPATKTPGRTKNHGNRSNDGSAATSW